MHDPVIGKQSNVRPIVQIGFIYNKKVETILTKYRQNYMFYTEYNHYTYYNPHFGSPSYLAQYLEFFQKVFGQFSVKYQVEMEPDGEVQVVYCLVQASSILLYSGD